MSVNREVFELFLASPSDLGNERDLVKKIVSEFNDTWSDQTGVVFKVWSWENDSWPSAGIDAQSVVNAQASVEYDVFLGMFWGRFGTPTSRARSGTKEEFDRAFERYKANQSSPEMMLYFKDAPISPSQIDAAQISLVMNFKAELGQLGILYFTFDGEKSFEELFRKHIAKVALKLGKERRENGTAGYENNKELGILEHLEVYQTGLEEMRDIGKVCADTLNDMSKRVFSSAKTLSNGGIKNLSNAKIVASVTSSAFAQSTGRLREKTDLLVLTANSTFFAIDSLVQLHNTFAAGKKIAKSLAIDLRGLADAMSLYDERMGLIQAAIAGFPKLSREVIRDRDFLSRQITKFRTAMRLAINRLHETIVNLEINQTKPSDA